MYRVVIADDEILVRIGLKSMIPWEDYGFELVGEAVNGKEAVKLIEDLKPHIVITDIQMPEMDGIELIKWVKKNNHTVHFIVLSCHNDFEYVKEAMKLGAKEYILKLSMKTDDLIATLNEVVKDISEEEKKSDRLTLMEKQINESKYNLKNDFFKFLLEAALYNREEVILKAGALKLDVRNSFYLVAAVEIDNYEKVRSDNKLQDEYLLNLSVMNILEEIVKEDLHGEVFIVENGCYAVFANVPYKEYKESEEIFRVTLTRFSESIHQYLGFTASSGISGLYEDLCLIKTAFGESREALDGRFYVGKGSVIPSKDKAALRRDNILDLQLSGKLGVLFELCDVANALEALGFIFNCLKEGNIHPVSVRKTVVDIVDLLEKTGAPYGFKACEVKEEAGSLFAFLENMDIFEDIKNWTLDFSRSFLEKLREARSRKFNRDVVKAMDYVKVNYSNPDLSTSLAAKYICMNPDYFSHLFKQETGQSFTSFLTGIRMQEAVKLMKVTDMKLYEVSQSVGYENFSYFSKLFKKVMGLNISDIRRQSR